MVSKRSVHSAMSANTNGRRNAGQSRSQSQARAQSRRLLSRASDEQARQDLLAYDLTNEHWDTFSLDVPDDQETPEEKQTREERLELVKVRAGDYVRYLAGQQSWKRLVTLLERFRPPWLAYIRELASSPWATNMNNVFTAMEQAAPKDQVYWTPEVAREAANEANDADLLAYAEQMLKPGNANDRFKAVAQPTNSRAVQTQAQAPRSTQVWDAFMLWLAVANAPERQLATKMLALVDFAKQRSPSTASPLTTLIEYGSQGGAGDRRGLGIWDKLLAHVHRMQFIDDTHAETVRDAAKKHKDEKGFLQWQLKASRDRASKINCDWALDAKEGDQFNEACGRLVHGVDDAFGDFAARVQKICSDAAAGPSPEVLAQAMLREFDPPDDFNKVTFDVTDPADPLAALLEREVGDLPVVIHPNGAGGLHAKIKNKGQDGEGDGVVRTFFTSCVEQLSAELLHQTEDGAYPGWLKAEVVAAVDAAAAKAAAANSKMMQARVNSAAANTAASNAAAAKKAKAKSAEDYLDPALAKKLRLLGWFVAFMAGNEWLRFPFDIKRALLHKCLHGTDAGRDLSYAVYQAIDDEQWSLFNALKRPDDIAHAGMNFSDLGMADRNVTKRNYLSYMRAYVAHNFVPAAYDIIAAGFVDAGGRRLLPLGCTVHTLRQAVCTTEVSSSDIQKFVDGVEFASGIPHEVQAWFKRVVGGLTSDRFKRLLYFWSGVTSPMPKEKYRVALHALRKFEAGKPGVDKPGQVCVRPLPEAHTCYTQLDLPAGIPSEKDLEEVLRMAVDNVEAGVGMLGGGNRSARRQRARSSRAVSKKASAHTHQARKATARSSRTKPSSGRRC